VIGRAGCGKRRRAARARAVGPAEGGTAGQAGLTLMEILIAIVVVGIGVTLFMFLQRSSGTRFAGNSSLLKAGQMVEKHMETLRIGIARDTSANWPPRDTSFREGRISLVRKVSAASSPKNGAPLPNVRRIDILAAWGTGPGDSLAIITYVAKRN